MKQLCVCAVCITWRFVPGSPQVDEVLNVLLNVTLLQRLPYFLIELQ